MSGIIPFPINDLPSELQREIFVLAADNDPKNTTNLVLVARRVNSWVQPRMYRMVTLGETDVGLFLRTMDSKPPSFFQNHVRHLCLTTGLNILQATRILASCRNVVNLALWVDFLGRGNAPKGSVTPLISSLRLKRLSIEYRHLLDVYYHPSTPPPIWYRTLTHLDLVFWVNTATPPVPFLGELEGLTHLSLGLRGLDILDIDHDYLKSILDDFQRLHILLVLLDEMALEADVPESKDPRIIFMPYPNVVEDWEAYWMGTPNVWSKAEVERSKRLEAAKSVTLGSHSPLT